MGPLDAVWHLLNLFGAALGMGVIVPSLAKLCWRRELRAAPWVALAGWVAASGALVTVLGLVISGRDGRMGSYLALVVASALALWWRGWGPGSKRG